MKRILISAFALGLTIIAFAVAGHRLSTRQTVQARTAAAVPAQAQPPRCSNSTASGTYGYRMNGTIVGVGPFLVNGFFVHNLDG
ncbi:MAG TPA: hypothetical protein VFZ34_25865, partial [Blastocatellia bacterium]|nr:hypothetical protein [Blastocatellia bacterium]